MTDSTQCDEEARSIDAKDNLTLLSEYLSRESLASKLLNAYRQGEEPALQAVLDKKREELRHAHAETAPQEN